MHPIGHRRRLAAWLALWAGLVPLPAAWAQAPRPITALGVFSLLGDGVEVTVNDSAPADTRIARNRRDTYTVPKAGFDIIATHAVRQAAARELPGASIAVFAPGGELPAAEQRRIAADARDGALPEWILDIVRQRRFSHVLLITRQRSELSLRTADGDAIGRGTADGIGFYIDTLFSVRDVDHGAVAKGALGPHVFVQLTLMDTESAEVVRDHTVRDQWLVGPTDSKAEVDPWSYLTPAQKVLLLRTALERNLQRVLPALLAGK